MPKDTTKSTDASAGQKDAHQDRFAVLTHMHHSRRVLLRKSHLECSYETAVQVIKKTLKLDNDYEVLLQTSELPACDGKEAEIPPEEWSYVIPMISRIDVRTTRKKAILDPPHPLPACTNLVSSSALPNPDADKITVNVYLLEPWTLITSLKMVSTTPMNRVVSAAFDIASSKRLVTGCEADYRFLFDGMRISGIHTPLDLGLEDGDEIVVMEGQTAGKPVIYLCPPKHDAEMDVSVHLSLVPQWKFSTIYPVVPTKPSSASGESLSWSVRTHPDQTMTEKSTGLTVSYLYWEAVTQALLPSPPQSPRSDRQLESFDPISSDLVDDDGVSVILPLTKVTPYLDAALKALGLHTEARTSFITYWLPSFNKHTHIALRFISQDGYERAAPLDIIPKPDVVIRVFMLFKGVREPSLWLNATARATEEVDRWRGIVGLSAEEKMSDESLFRVLEWGGMEVKR